MLVASAQHCVALRCIPGLDPMALGPCRSFQRAVHMEAKQLWEPRPHLSVTRQAIREFFVFATLLRMPGPTPARAKAVHPHQAGMLQCSS